MKEPIEIDALLAPIPGDNPAGEDLRYSQVYEEIKEARRADDPVLSRDDPKAKTADWNKVIKVSVGALTSKTKDLQIAAWLTEALVRTEGFQGMATGLTLLASLLRDYWDSVYPVIEEEDMEFRAAPLTFLNEKLSTSVREISLTDPRATPGYGWLKWVESREVGHESDTVNRFGSTDEVKKAKRDELIAEGKITAEEFDSALAKSPKGFYESLSNGIALCHERLTELDGVIDERFGREGPSLTELRKTVEEVAQFVEARVPKEKKGVEPGTREEGKAARVTEEKGISRDLSFPESTTFQPGGFPDSDSQEKMLWEEALQTLKASGVKAAVGKLLGASHSAPSARARNRYRLLMAKLCLEADRPDLARPIVEELNALIEELHLDRWESPLWIAEILEALYRCLTGGEEPSSDDLSRGKSLFQRLCTMDVRKAMVYKQ